MAAVDQTRMEFVRLADFPLYVCRQSKCQLSKEFGFHILSGAADYHAQWFPEGDRWSLYISSYSDNYFPPKEKNTAGNC